MIAKCNCALALASLFLLLLVACGSEEATSTPSAAPAPAVETPPPAPETPPPAEEESKSLPTKTENVALNQGESKIPASIDVPEGCTTFNDTATTIRLDHGKMGKAFGVQVKEGNEFNTNHEKFAGELKQNQYGNINEIVEQDDKVLLWKTRREDSKNESYRFRLIVDLAGKQWVCTQGNYGGWSREEADRQIEACKTLKAL